MATVIPPIIQVASNGYINLPVTTDPTTIASDAIAAIAQQVPGWVPRESHIEVLVLEQVAAMIAEGASVASQVPLDIFAYLGANLFGIAPQNGLFATALTTWVMVDNSGYTVPANTVVGYQTLGNQLYLFQTTAPFTVAPGSTTATGITITATEVGTFYNNFAPQIMVMSTALAFVYSVVATTTSSGGQDAETLDQYTDRLSDELQLLTPRPIVPSDFSALAPNVPGVFRAITINGLNPGRSLTDGVLTSGSNIVTSATGNFASATDVGRSFSNSNFVGGTTITSVTNSTTIVVSNPSGANATAQILVLGDLDNQERTVAVCGIDSYGNALSGPTTTLLNTYLQSMREVNFIVSMLQPTKTGVDVTVSLNAVHGYAPAVVQASVLGALTGFLSPATWGGGTLDPPQWIYPSNTVSILDIANVIYEVPGVLYVPSGDLQIALHGNSLGLVDLTLPGDAPLPTPATLVVTVTAT